MIYDDNVISQGKLQEYASENHKDLEMSKLINIIKNGWPDHKSKLDSALKPYWNYREELVIIDNVVFKGHQIVIPTNFRNEVLSKIHYNHLGIEKSIIYAKQFVFWPLMNQDIENLVSNCTTCLTYQNQNQKETIINRNLPQRPWETVASDLFHFDGRDYLLVVDYYSKYPEVIHLKNNTTSENVIVQLKSVFARHGKPDNFLSDNGPQFSSVKFKQFLESWDIKRITSTPHYPQSNGFIERHVQTIKRLFKKAYHDNKDIYLCLLEYRNTPIGRNLPSPAQLLFSRSLKGQLPVNEKLLQPRVINSDYAVKLADRQETSAFHYNKNAKDLTDLDVNDKVMIYMYNGKWEPGIIVKIDNDRPRAYYVKHNRTGNIYNRNRRFLRKFKIDNFNNKDQDLHDTMYKDYLAKYEKTGNSSSDLLIESKTENPIVTNENSNVISENPTESVENPMLITENCEFNYSKPINCSENIFTKRGNSPLAMTLQNRTRSGREVKKPFYLKDYVSK